MSLYLRDKLNFSATLFSLPACSTEAEQSSVVYKFCTLSGLSCSLYIDIVLLYRMYKKGVNYCCNKNKPDKKRASLRMSRIWSRDWTSNKTLLQIIWPVSDWQWLTILMTGWRPPRPPVWCWRSLIQSWRWLCSPQQPVAATCHPPSSDSSRVGQGRHPNFPSQPAPALADRMQPGALGWEYELFTPLARSGLAA